MKAVIVLALKELVVTKFGEEKWIQVLKEARVGNWPLLLPIADVDDTIVIRILDAVCKTLGLSIGQAADAFGEYWMNAYAPRMYFPYFEGIRSAREFLLNMDKVHVNTTRSVKNAHPPRFEYEWENDRTLIMTYISKRELMLIFIGLIKGVGKYFKEDLQVQQMGNNKVRIIFESYSIEQGS